MAIRFVSFFHYQLKNKNKIGGSRDVFCGLSFFVHVPFNTPRLISDIISSKNKYYLCTWTDPLQAILTYIYCRVNFLLTRFTSFNLARHRGKSNAHLHILSMHVPGSLIQLKQWMTRAMNTTSHEMFISLFWNTHCESNYYRLYVNDIYHVLRSVLPFHSKLQRTILIFKSDLTLVFWAPDIKQRKRRSVYETIDIDYKRSRESDFISREISQLLYNDCLHDRCRSAHRAPCISRIWQI